MTINEPETFMEGYRMSMRTSVLCDDGRWRMFQRHSPRSHKGFVRVMNAGKQVSVSGQMKIIDTVPMFFADKESTNGYLLGGSLQAKFDKIVAAFIAGCIACNVRIDKDLFIQSLTMPTLSNPIPFAEDTSELLDTPEEILSTMPQT